MSDNITKEEFLTLATEEKNTKEKNTEEKNTEQKNTISKEEFLSLAKTEGSQKTDVTAGPQIVSTGTESTSEDGSSESQDIIYDTSGEELTTEKTVESSNVNEEEGTTTFTYVDGTQQIVKTSDIEGKNFPQAATGDPYALLPEVAVGSEKHKSNRLVNQYN